MNENYTLDFTADDLETEASSVEVRPSLPQQEAPPRFSATIARAEKMKILVACLFSMCLGNMMILNMESFLPTYLEDKVWVSLEDDYLDSTDCALIIGVFSVAQIIFAPFNALVKNWLGSKTTMLIGFALVAVTTTCLGLISVSEDPFVFRTLSVILRFIQGQGDVMLQITASSIITSIFSDQVMRYVSYGEVATGLGLGLGPVIGSLFYSKLDYAGTMYMFGFIDLLGLFACQMLLPDLLNATVSEEEAAELGEDDLDEDDLDDLIQAGQMGDLDALKIALRKKRQQSKVSWKTVLTDRHCLFALLVCFVGTFNTEFNAGYVAVELSDMGFSESEVGFVFASMSFAYLISCALLPCTCEKSSRKVQFIVAMLGFGFSILLMGPSSLLSLPESIWLVIAGFPLRGFFQVFVFVPIIPEMLERLQVKLYIQEGVNPKIEQALNDRINDAYGVVFALSNFLSPMVGSLLYSEFGMSQSCDIFGIANLILAGLLFYFNCGLRVFEEETAFKEELAHLRTGQVKVRLQWFGSQSHFVDSGLELEHDHVALQKGVEAQKISYQPVVAWVDEVELEQGSFA